MYCNILFFFYCRQGYASGSVFQKGSNPDPVWKLNKKSFQNKTNFYINIHLPTLKYSLIIKCFDFSIERNRWTLFGFRAMDSDPVFIGGRSPIRLFSKSWSGSECQLQLDLVYCVSKIEIRNNLFLFILRCATIFP